MAGRPIRSLFITLLVWSAFIAIPSHANVREPVPTQCRGTWMAEDLVTESRAILGENSARVAADIRAHMARGVPYVVDFLGIGAGPIQSVFAANLIHYDVTAIYLNADQYLGTFDRDRNFNTNSMEFLGESANFSPGSPVQPMDFNTTGRMFAPAESVGDATTVSFRFGRGDVVFGQRGTHLEVRPDSEVWPADYRVTTDQGLIVYTHNIGIATGLGRPTLHLDEASQPVLLSEQERIRRGYNSRIHFVDDFIEATETQSLSELVREGDVIAIVGGGDGRRIVVEALAGVGPRASEPAPVGQVITIAPAQTASLDERFLRWLRYGQPGAEARRRIDISERRGRVTGVREMADGKLRLIIQDDTGIREQVVNQVVFATGYENAVPELLTGVAHSSEITLDPVYDQTGRHVIARRVRVGTQSRRIYTYGLAARTEEDRRADNAQRERDGLFASYLRLYGNRASVLPSVIFPQAFRAPQLLEAGNQSRFSLPAANESMHASDLDLHLQLEMGRIFSQFRSSGAGRLTVVIDSELQVSVRGQRWSEETLQAFRQAMMSNANLMAYLTGFADLAASAQGSRRIEVTITTNINGRFLLHNLDVALR